MTTQLTPERIAQTREILQEYKQEHLFAYFDTLDESQKAQLIGDIEQINFPAVAQLIDSHVCSSTPFPLPKDIQPAPFYPARPDMNLAGQYADALKRGEALIRQNKVAPFTVAGGQGTRLGFDGPKGAYPISVIQNKPLFQLFAESILGINHYYGSDLTWYLMTSPDNDEATRNFFEKNGYFGLSAERVRFFQQGVMPAFSPEGKILLDQKHRIALSPDGHGGSLLALKRSGALAEMAEAGIDYISYFQVDNPLVKTVDPLFIGLHDLTKSEMSSKTIPKADDLERVGNFVLGDGKSMVIEYSDLPEELARARNDAGERLFDAASIAIHILSRSFVERLTADQARFALDWHRAIKKVPYINENGNRIHPDQPNAVKLETFIFDAIGHAHHPLILQTIRAEEFSPIKNASGVDSPDTARRDLNRRAAAWLEAAGFEVPRTPEGEPDGRFEFSPRLIPESSRVREVLPQGLTITAGQDHYWE